MLLPEKPQKHFFSEIVPPNGGCLPRGKKMLIFPTKLEIIFARASSPMGDIGFKVLKIKKRETKQEEKKRKNEKTKLNTKRFLFCHKFWFVTRVCIDGNDNVCAKNWSWPKIRGNSIYWTQHALPLEIISYTGSLAGKLKYINIYSQEWWSLDTVNHGKVVISRYMDTERNLSRAHI